ncbi:MAG: hypothetical protein SNJ84_10175, partial [Verrucomicrobiia bacterium]
MLSGPHQPQLDLDPGSDPPATPPSSRSAPPKFEHLTWIGRGIQGAISGLYASLLLTLKNRFGRNPQLPGPDSPASPPS